MSRSYCQSGKVSIFGCAETFSTSDEKPYNLDNDYQWVGKCRKGNKKIIFMGWDLSLTLILFLLLPPLL
jgi:hypothetical protein